MVDFGQAHLFSRKFISVPIPVSNGSCYLEQCYQPVILSIGAFVPEHVVNMKSIYADFVVLVDEPLQYVILLCECVHLCSTV